MRNKKAPSLAAVGAGKKGGKVVNLACPHSATPPRSSQSECCANCQFFRRVALPSGHDRKLCMMTGEKLRTAAGWCDLFAAGSWEETWADPNPSPLPKWLLRTAERLRALTHALVSGMVEAPNNTRRNRRLCRAPHGEKSGLFCFVSIPATGASCERRYISTGHVQYPRGLAALCWPGSVSRLFLYPQSLKQHRCSMHSIPLFRSASCGGRASLSFLLRKLARAGETAALVALLGTSLSTSARVRWAMLGNVLTVKEVRHVA